MNDNEIFTRIQNIIFEITETFGYEKVSVKLNTHLVQELGMDSPDLIDVFYKVKTEFTIVTKNGDIEDFYLEHFLKNPTPKVMLDFVKNAPKVNQNTTKPNLKFPQNPKFFYQR